MGVLFHAFLRYLNSVFRQRLHSVPESEEDFTYPLGTKFTSKDYQNYKFVVEQLFCHPFGRAALMREGILSRIAQQYPLSTARLTGRYLRCEWTTRARCLNRSDQNTTIRTTTSWNERSQFSSGHIMSPRSNPIKDPNSYLGCVQSRLGMDHPKVSTGLYGHNRTKTYFASLSTCSRRMSWNP
ncbi:hypothetical protein BJ165DRAFT_766900 [Panaeolus papilionaceus]|nr:hypothetical protein BJ165DRAFT_766900 [Panaeolus papilionaceus]